MAKLKILCSGCFNIHKLSQKKFPLLLFKRVDVIDKKGKHYENRPVGFLCVKCSRKKTIQDEMLKDPELGKLGWRQAINRFLNKPKLKIGETHG